MFKKMKHMKNEKGLTLIELLAVIVILAIIAAIAIPAIGNIIENSRYNAVKSDAINVINAAQLYYLDTPDGQAASGTTAFPVAATTTSITVSDLIGLGYLENAGKVATTSTVTKTKPHKLSGTGTISGSGSTAKTITFTGASLTGINGDTQKGSQSTLTAITQ